MGTAPLPCTSAPAGFTWIHSGSHMRATGHAGYMFTQGWDQNTRVLLLPIAGQHQGVAGGGQCRMQAQGASKV